MRACGPARADRGPMRVEPRTGLQAHFPSPPRVFSAGLQAEPAGQALIAIPSFIYEIRKIS